MDKNSSFSCRVVAGPHYPKLYVLVVLASEGFVSIPALGVCYRSSGDPKSAAEEVLKRVGLVVKGLHGNGQVLLASVAAEGQPCCQNGLS